MGNILLQASDIEKSFIQPDRERLVILQGLNLEVEQGSVVAITGASGSGKSTLLHLLGSLDAPDRGQVLFSGEDVGGFSRKRLSAYRNRDIGFVFQFHYLMPELTVLENTASPGLIQRFQRPDAFKAAGALLADEPTGSLDWKTGESVFAVFKRMIRERGLTAVIATHNPQLAELTDRKYLLHGGRLEEIQH